MNRKEKVTLGNISNIITGPFGSQLHQSDYVPVGIACIMPQNIGNRTLNKDGIARITKKDAERLSRYVVRVDDIVYARRGDVEKHAYISSEDDGALCGTGCMRVRVDSEKAYPLYVSFYLNRPESKRWISQHAVGSNMPNLNTEILNNVPIELPSMAEQKIISHFLENIDKKIQLNAQIYSELEAMAKTLYDYWFVQFDFPDENGRPYRTSGGEMVWNEQLKREIPKGWSVVPLGNILELLKDGTHNPPKRHSEGVPLLTGTMFGHIVLSYNGVTYIEQTDYDSIHANYAPQKNDFIMTKIGSVGNVNILRENDIPLAIHCNSALIRFQKYIPISYVFFMLKSTFFQAYLKKEVSKTVQEFVSLERLAGIQICLPDDKILHQFADIIDKVFDSMMLCETENCELAKLRDWLLPMLMNGQARVE